MLLSGRGGPLVAQPFFTIGVPTYNRHDLLRETLNSILAQDFIDFEVIVGNDYTDEELSGEMIGISDPRIRYVNHPQNLREVGNMNALLDMASGRYFTWLFDDDLHEPGYLATAYQFLTDNDFPPALFSSFRQLRGENGFSPREVTLSKHRLLTGREFLREYFAGHVKIVSTSGLFDTSELKNVVGGVEELCGSTIGVYCEYLFLVRCALLGRIAYLDAPFVVMRLHSDSWSQSNLQLNKFREAGQPLVKRCADVFRNQYLAADLYSNLLGISKLHLYSFAYKSAKHEIALNKFGIGAAYRAITRLAEENAVTKRTVTEETGGEGLFTTLGFLRMLIRHSCLVFAWLLVFWMRRFRPSFMQLTRSYTPK